MFTHKYTTYFKDSTCLIQLNHIILSYSQLTLTVEKKVTNKSMQTYRNCDLINLTVTPILKASFVDHTHNHDLQNSIYKIRKQLCILQVEGQRKLVSLPLKEMTVSY